MQKGAINCLNKVLKGATYYSKKTKKCVLSCLIVKLDVVIPFFIFYIYGEENK